MFHVKPNKLRFFELNKIRKYNIVFEAIKI